jgi:beta-galactosidase
LGDSDSKLKATLDKQGVLWTGKPVPNRPSLTSLNSLNSLFILDGNTTLSGANEKLLTEHLLKGADVWIWGITPQTVDSYAQILPLPIWLEANARSSFLPVSQSWMNGLKNSDFYFCELQKTDAAFYGLAGDFVREGQTLLHACPTDWRKWNKQAEEIKTASTVRSENEQTGATPVFVKYEKAGSSFYISTLTEFANSEKGFNTLSKILENAGIPCQKTSLSTADIFFIRDERIQFPVTIKSKLQNKDDYLELELWVFSPRPLDDLLIEPDMPKLDLLIEARESKLRVNNVSVTKFNRVNKECDYKELPLQQGWNHLVLSIGKKDIHDFKGFFKCDNKKDFLALLKVSLTNPEQ